MKLKIENRIIRKLISDITRNPWLHFITSSTVTVSIVIIGIFYLLYRNFEVLSEKASPKVMGTIYLKEKLEEKELIKLREKLLFLENVENITYKNRNDVIQEINSLLGNANISYLNEVFPDVIELTLKKDTTKLQVDAISKIITDFPEVLEVDFSNDWMEKYEKMKNIFKIIFILLSTIVFIGCTFITANFIGIRQETRKKEIEISRLVGANNLFIFKPFFLEGIIEGIISGVLAIFFLLAIKSMFSTALMSGWSDFFELPKLVFLSSYQSTSLILFAILINSFGSFIAFLQLREKTL